MAVSNLAFLSLFFAHGGAYSTVPRAFIGMRGMNGRDGARHSLLVGNDETVKNIAVPAYATITLLQRWWTW